MEAEAAPSCYNLVAHHGANYGHRYYSPYYHHITISNLQPSTTYYYKPVIHARADDFRLRGSSSSNSNATSSSTMMSSNYYFSNHETLERLQEELEEDYFHRQLSSSSSGRSPPYDGTSKECPSPEKIRSFRTAPPPGSDATVSIAIMGDIGQFPHSEETLARMIRARASIDTVILAGDVAYAGADHKLWDTFFDFMDDYPIAEHFGMQIVPGNHDIDKEPAGDQIFLAYEHRFRMPRVQPAKLGRYHGPTGYMSMDQPPYPMPYEWGNAYYAYTYGPARMIMISSYSAMEPGSTQYEWIVKELQAVDRSITPWVLAVLHTPIYNTFSLHQKDTQILKAREFLEPLFVEYQVNMVFSGHIHAYLRTEKVAVGVNHHKGPMHVTIGAGGRKCEAPFLKEEPEPWVAVRDATVYGYGMFRVFNRTHAEWDWIHTGYSDDRTYNEVKRSNVTLPSVSMDRVVITNQFYSEE
jgi:predicted phosphodiesterase